MERLAFGIRAQRRARRQRLKRRIALASIAATLLGVPGATFGVNLIERALGPDLARPAEGAETTEAAASMLKFRARAFETRPPEQEATQETVQQPEPLSSYELIVAAATEFGLDPDYLVSVAQCESNLDPYAYSPAGYHGLFQFDQTTWSDYGYGDIYDPAAQARTAARLIAAGQTSRWPNCA